MGFWEEGFVGRDFVCVVVVVVGGGVSPLVLGIAVEEGVVVLVGLGHKDPGIEGEGRKEVALVLIEYLSSSVSSSSVSREVEVAVEANEALDGRRSCGCICICICAGTGTGSGREGIFL